MSRDRAYAAAVAEELRALYPDGECQLKYEGEPWKLLCMAILSAQCTDARVNLVSEKLFAVFPDVYAMADAGEDEIGELVRSCGLWRAKAAAIKGSCRRIADEYGGEVPSGMDDLLSLPGVGRKIANLIRGDIFGLPGIVADTHCIRIASRLGFTAEGEKDPLRTEKALDAVVEPGEQAEFCHRLVLFGRDVCPARNPRCGECPLRAKGLCGSAAEGSAAESSAAEGSAAE